MGKDVFRKPKIVVLCALKKLHTAKRVPLICAKRMSLTCAKRMSLICAKRMSLTCACKLQSNKRLLCKAVPASRLLCMHAGKAESANKYVHHCASKDACFSLKKFLAVPILCFDHGVKIMCFDHGVKTV